MRMQTTPTREPMSDDLVLLPYLLSIAKSVRQLVSLKLAECGVVVGQDQFLLCFADEEAVSVAALAERLSVRASTVSKMADILQRKGWVGRQSDDHDARKVLVHLSEAGQQIRDVVRRVEEELEVELFKALGKEDGTLAALAKLDAVLTKRLSRLR